MKFIRLICILGLNLFVSRLNSVPCTVSFTNSTPITFQNQFQAIPYPSSIPVNLNLPAGVVPTITIGINNWTSTLTPALQAVLESPSNHNLVLFAEVGSNNTNNVSLTLADAPINPLPQGTLTSTIYNPQVYDNVNTFPLPAPQNPNLPETLGSSTIASAFAGTTFNGNWNLFVSNNAVADNGQFAGGWTLNFTFDLVASITGLTTYCVGETISLIANPEDATSYTWSKDGSPLGVTDRELIIPNATLEDAGTYTVTVVFGSCTVQASETVIVNPCGTTGCSISGRQSPLFTAIRNKFGR